MPVIASSFGLYLPIQLAPITTEVVSPISAHGEVNTIPHYVIKFVSVLRQIDGFLYICFTNTTDSLYISGILLKVAIHLHKRDPYYLFKKNFFGTEINLNDLVVEFSCLLPCSGRFTFLTELSLKKVTIKLLPEYHLNKMGIWY